MTDLKNATGGQFSQRLPPEANRVTNAPRAITEDTGWDVEKRKVHSALPHDLPRADGGDILHTSHALPLPFDLHPDMPPDVARHPSLRINRDAPWGLVDPEDGKADRPRRGSYVVGVTDADQARLRPLATSRDEIIAAFKSGNAPLFTTSLIVNLLGITAVLFIILVGDFAVPTRSESVLLPICAGLILFALLELTARRLRGAALVRFASDLEHRLGRHLLHKVMPLRQNFPRGSDLSQQKAWPPQLESLRKAMLDPIGQAALDLPFLVLYGGLILALSPKVGALLIGAALLFFFVFALFQPGIKSRASQEQKTAHAFRRRIAEVVDNQDAIRGVGSAHVWNDRLRMAHNDDLEARIATQRHVQTSGIVLQALIMAGAISAGLLTTYLAVIGELALGVVAGMVVLVWRFLTPLQTMAQAGAQIQAFRQSAHQFEEMCAIPGEPYRRVAPEMTPEIKFPIVFDQVTLRFADSLAPPLQHASLRINDGAITSLSGSNMSGKTKLAELIAGLYSPTGGRVLINGTDMRQIPVADLRAAIAFAPQEPQVFNGSIAQNLDFARPGVSEDKMWRALLEAGIDGYVRKLPDGLATRFSYDTFKRLPYGVQKGLTLAQTFLRPGPIFIFDDPMFGVDKDQEVFIRLAIKSRRTRGGVLLISNSPADLDLADHHIFLDRGRVSLNESAERGRPKLDTLINRDAA